MRSLLEVLEAHRRPPQLINTQHSTPIILHVILCDLPIVQLMWHVGLWRVLNTQPFHTFRPFPTIDNNYLTNPLL